MSAEPADHRVDTHAVSILAAQLLVTAGGTEGDFVFATIDARGGAPQHYRVANSPDAAAGIVELIERVGAQPHQNVYFAGSLFRSNAVTIHSGRTKKNVVGVLCAVTDFDAEHDPATRHKRLPQEPGSELESSAGNFHCHYWFDRPYPGNEIEPVLYALAAVAAADDCKSAEHLWRVPGTWNWPSSKKRATGRAPEPFLTRWTAQPEVWDTVSAGDLHAAILKANSEAFKKPPASGVSNADFDWSRRQKPREQLDDKVIARALTEEGDRSALAFKLIRRLQRSGYSPEEVVAALLKYSSLPVMGHYGDPVSEDRVRDDVQRAYCKPDQPIYQRSATSVFRIADAGTCTTEVAAPLPLREIKIQGGARPENVDQAEAALVAQGIGVFQRVSMLMRPAEMTVQVRGGEPVNDLVLVSVGASELIEHMTSAATFTRWDGRMQDWKCIDCPREIAETLLARVGRWKLRPLMGILNAPTLRSDGSLLDGPGYDTDTALLYDPRGTVFPAIPAEPTQDDARQSLAVLNDLIGKFPFASPEARAVALAGILTSCVRRTLPTAPIFGIDGTGPGTGKGLLADTIATIGSGRAASPITAGANEEELEKRVASMLIRGDLAICIDNLSAPLESTFLCSVLTQETQSVRVLGQSRTVTLPTNCLFLATGNALTFAGDLWRRGLNCLIDPEMEKPSERVFEFNPVERARQDRGKYVTAALTIMRAYQVASRPKQGGKQMGSFEIWCRTVRDPLLWLGEADAGATCTPSTDDPERERFAAVIGGWEAVIGEGRNVTLKQAIEQAERGASATPARPDLLDAFHAVAAPMVRGSQSRVDTRRLGYWMRNKKRQVIRGLRFMSEGESQAGNRWRLERAQGREA